MKIHTFTGTGRDLKTAVMLAEEAANTFLDESIVDSKRFLWMTTNDRMFTSDDGTQNFIFIITLALK